MASKRALPNTTPQSPAAAKAIAAAAPPLAIVAKPDAEITAITSAVMKAFDEYADPGLAVNDAKDASKDANAKAEGARERLMKRMAKLSADKGWNSPAKIEEACKIAATKWAEGKNRTPDTLTQLRSELYRAMHPEARAYVEDAFEDAKTTWAEERAKVADARDEIAAQKAAGTAQKDLPKLPDQPLMKTFAKSYHMVAGSKGILQAHIDVSDKTKLVSSHEEAADPLLLADARNQQVREDPKAAARVLAKLVATIEDIYAEFPAESLKSMLRFAGNLNADNLAAAKISAQRAAQRATTPATPRRVRNTTATGAIDDALDDIIA